MHGTESRPRTKTTVLVGLWVLVTLTFAGTAWILVDEDTTESFDAAGLEDSPDETWNAQPDPLVDEPRTETGADSEGTSAPEDGEDDHPTADSDGDPSHERGPPADRGPSADHGPPDDRGPPSHAASSSDESDRGPPSEDGPAGIDDE
ncbi:hypothetical protein [Halovivax gelatinilyticus]|uniref:hypothetical protein n=1 Tax=Halovivax gelatinilyticus TaxID=2961597 RepID=UPI0020CA7EF4|nr:hypothetical protein [Halovivax gelatinilyticus]